jgi:mutator protein MutT
MRAGVDYPGVGVGALVLNSKGKFLMGLRGSASRNESGKWSFPGGKVEFMEKLEDAVVREVKEEFNIDIEVVRLLKVVNHFIPSEKQHWVNPIFLCKLIGGEVKVMEKRKHSDFGWFTLKDHPSNVAVNNAEVLNDIKAGRIKMGF